MSEPPSITCLRCGKTSHHPGDVREGYCGACHDFTSRTRGRFATLYLTMGEIDTLAVSLALSLDSTLNPPPADAHAASRVVWKRVFQDGAPNILGSLATMLSEVRTRLELTES